MTHHELYTQCAKVLSLTDCDNLLLVQVDEGNEVDCEYAEDHDPVLERHNLPSVYITSRYMLRSGKVMNWAEQTLYVKL